MSDMRVMTFLDGGKRTGVIVCPTCAAMVPTDGYSTHERWHLEHDHEHDQDHDRVRGQG
jgi:hypothetical protein